jgi:hypothetical protein
MLWFAQGSASRQCRGRRRATAVGWRDRLESEPPWQAAPQMGDRASADSLRWNLDLVVDQRGADTADLPGGASGMLCRDYKGIPSRKRARRGARSAGIGCAPAST